MVTRVTKLLVGVAVLLVVLLAAALFIDEPLRAYVEQKMNRSLKGYRVHIGALDFHPIGASLDLHESDSCVRMSRILRWPRLHAGRRAFIGGRSCPDVW